MSWTDELYKIYELYSDREFEENEPVMLPVSHSTANAQAEIVLDTQGNFISASAIDKKESQTIIPVTEDSGTRSSGIAPMPFADKLIYIAGDYQRYSGGKRSDNSQFYSAYMEQLKNWRNSAFFHPAVKAVYTYLDKKSVVSDLVMSGVLQVDDETGKLAEKVKLAGISQEDVFVRFVIIGNTIPQTWLDNTLYESFISYNSKLMGQTQLCYASGDEVPVTYKHPSKIRNTGDKAKLFSANDESGFSFRGRFADKKEALSISYIYSQKIHNALRWLIQKQGENIDSLTVVAWASEMQPMLSYKNRFYDDDIIDEDSVPSTMPMYMQMLKKRIFGYRDILKPDTKMMIMGLDSATTGRLSVSFYSEIDGSQYLDNIEIWHRDTAWRQYSTKKKCTILNSFSLYDIIRCAFGSEKGKFLEYDTAAMSTDLLRLIPCVTERRNIPKDIISALYNKASNPLSYGEGYNHRKVLDTACGMIRKYLIDINKYDNAKGDILMAYESQERDRNYLYGCLLAIADKAESEAYSKEDRSIRVTNAKRYWATYSQRPYQTWQIIEEHLRPYLTRLGKGQIKYEKWINEIMDKLTPGRFTDNSKLEPLYLLGYHHFMDYMYNSNSNEKEEG